MNGRKLSNDKQYTLLIKKLEEAKKRKSNSCRDKITGIYLEIAEYLRNGLFLVEEAEQYYNKVIAWGEDYNECALDCSLAYRNLAEMAIGKNQFDVAIEKINLSAEFAYKSNDPGIIQQALHQRAHICLSCDLPEKALEYAEICRRYLSEYSEEIDSLRKDGDSNSRLAHLQNLIAAIYLELYNSDNFQQYNYNKKGLDVNEKCIKYAMENKDWTLAYRGLLVKLSLTVGQERLQIAELMCSMASKITPKNADERRFRRECKCHFALEKLRYCEQGNVGSGKKLLWKCYEDMQKEADDFSADLHEDVRNALFFVYKTEQREKKANSMNVKDNARRRRAQMVVFEKIGDDATKQGMNEISLHFYQKMLKCADSLEDQRKAWCSMAEAAKDCRLWERAMTFYKQVLKLEQQLGYNEAQMLETEIAIAIVSAEVDKLSAEERFHLMKRTYAKCKLAKQKRNILPDFVKFLKAHSNLCTKEELDTRCKEKTKLELYSRGEEGEDDNPQELVEEPPETDEFDEMNEGRMLWALRKEMKTLDQQEKIIKDRSNKNKHGESSLHEVARSGDYQRLKELVEKGYDVNQLDHGGWTPLSEAVTAGNMANVRLLLMSGANTNTRSTEFLVDAEENKITSSGLSPLMEACSSGNIEIARILLQFKARASSRDDDDWTALEYLWEFLLNAKRLEAEKRELLQKFAERLKKKQMDEGFTPRTYKEFLEMVEAKKVASQRKNTSSNSLESDKRRRRGSGRQRQVADIDSPTSSLSPARRSPSPLVTSSSNKRRRRTISIGNGSDEENWRDEDGGEEEEEESEEEDEETRNLDDYRKCIRGLRNRHSGGGEDMAADFSKPALLVSRKRGAGNSGAHSSAKKLFFK